MRNKKRVLLFVPLIIIGLSTLFYSFDDGDDFELLKNLEIYHSVVRELRILYVDKLDAGQLIQGSIEDMLADLDPYTNFYPESQIEDYRFMTTGEYAGIGIELTVVNNEFVVTNITEDAPADLAGLRIGDKLLSVDNNFPDEITIDAIRLLLNGQPNSNVNVQLKRIGQEEILDLNITRKKIESKDVPYFGLADEGIGYIKLIGFTANAGTEFKSAFQELKDKHNIKKLIVDLRGNPGGLLIEAVKIVNCFINPGEEVVSMRGQQKEWNKVFKTQNAALDASIPVVVLINNNSASASEIVAGALQDYDRAVVLGQASFGKGLVQTTRDLAYNAKMKITTAKYYIPSGRCIQKIDYSHKDKFGNVHEVPDSLISIFYTQNGREVYDGLGIIPDVIIESKTLSDISNALINNRVIFDYSVKYRNNNNTIKSIEDIKLTDKDIEDFKTFTDAYSINYKTETEKSLEKLVESSKEDQYYDRIKEQINILSTEIENHKENDFILFQSEIKDLLIRKIVYLYFYNKGVIQHDLKHDQYILESIAILNDSNRYQSILSN